MKEINNFINEALKIGSKSKVNKNNIDITIKYDQTFFTKKEFNDIIDFANTLEIAPDFVTKAAHSDNHPSSFINLEYHINEKYNKEDLVHPRTLIRIRKETTSRENYIIRIIKCDDKETYFYPDDGSYFHSIDECFENIKEYTKTIKFWDCVNKYK